MHTLTLNGQLPIHVESVNFRLRHDLRASLAKSAGSLFRRHGQLLGFKLKLKREDAGSSSPCYSATAHLALPGYDRIVVKKGERLTNVLTEIFKVAGRQLRLRAKALRAK